MRRRPTRRGPKPLGDGTLSTLGAIPGYGEVEGDHLRIERIDGDALAVAAQTSASLFRFLASRDSVALLAKSGEQLLKEMVLAAPSPGLSGLEQVHVELLQAFALAVGPGRRVPAAPNSMVRLWKLLERNLAAYLTVTAPGQDAGADAMLSRNIRLRTVYYRNVFSSDDAADVVPALLSQMDAVSEAELGYRLSDFARALFSLWDEVCSRFAERLDREQILRQGIDVDEVVQGMLDGSEWARRMWRKAAACPLQQKGRGWAGFQMAEMLCVPLFMFHREALVARFGEKISEALYSCSLTFGSLTEEDLQRVYLANPIWERPFVALTGDTLFLPLPVLIVSFPFAIVERLLGANQKLRAAYARARTLFLEEDVERIIRRSLPSAAVYRSVTWTDPDTKVLYEHDVVAVLGMRVLIFEAKSGKLAAAGRRGGLASLKTDFARLFVEPGVQASRLEALLASRRYDVILTDNKGEAVRLDPSGPSVVHKFGVCLEHFASVTSSRRLFREMGLLRSDQDWAPVLSLAELRMLSERLDTEISFLHYLTRRATADDVLDFVADEQDLLSLYLTNGFAVDTRGLEGRQVFFLQADAAVRGRASPRVDRREFATPGIDLPPMWNLVAKEIYASDDRHRFDILVTILNQLPGSLRAIAQRAQRWRSGAGGTNGDTAVCRMEVADRVFVVGVHMTKEPPLDRRSWADRARMISYDLAKRFGATDCVIILKVRRSRFLTFDGIGFFRFPQNAYRA